MTNSQKATSSYLLHTLLLFMPFSLTHFFRCIALLLSVALAGCASLDKYSYETFVKPPAGDRRFTPAEWPKDSDKRALLYADYQAQLLGGRATGSRVTRELSDSSLVVGGALTGAQETLGIAASSIASMGVGMVIAHELQGVFNARGRSEAFADAAYLIRQAQSELRQFNPDPSSERLTENGAILISRVDAAIHAARKTLNGRMPGLLDLQQATQPMTTAGARRVSSGVPETMFTASGVRERVTKAQGMTVREPKTVSPEEYAALLKKLNELQEDLPVNVEFVAGMRKINDSTKLTPDQKTALWTKIVGDAQLKGNVVETPNAIIKFFKDTATPAQRTALTTALNNNLPADL